MNKDKLLRLRKKIKSRKPEFVSQDSHKRKRIRKRWNKPRGWQSKIRLGKKGYRKMVTPGYGSPKKVYGLKKGLKPIMISSEIELEKLKAQIDKKGQGIIIAGSIGSKKRISIIKKAKQEGINIININNPEKYLKKIDEIKKKKKQDKEQKLKEKKEKKKAKEKKEKKESKLEKLSEEEKQRLKKKEKDKILTKKEN